MLFSPEPYLVQFFPFSPQPNLVYLFILILCALGTSTMKQEQLLLSVHLLASTNKVS